MCARASLANRMCWENNPRRPTLVVFCSSRVPRANTPNLMSRLCFGSSPHPLSLELGVTLMSENLLNLTPREAHVRLESFFEAAGEPRYRAAQVLRRLWTNPAPSFDAITELPKTLR